MKKIMTAALGLSLFSGAAALFAQNTSTGSTDTGSMKSTMKKSKKHHKKGTADTMSSTASTSTTK